MPKTIISKKDTTKKATKEKGEEKKEKLKAKEVVQTAAQEEVPKQEASLFKSVPKEAPVISEPVKATPIERKKDGDRKKISTFGLSKERDHFIENLSMLVLSGMAITEALRAVVKETKDARMKEILTQVMDDIEAGSPIWKAFTETGLFRGYTISLIRLGEESGKLADNLKVIALQEEKDREFKSKVKSALMYPVFVLSLTGFIGIGISWFILPKLAKIFTDLKLQLPFITKVLIGFGVFLNKHGIIVVPLGLLVMGGIFYIIFVYEKTKILGEYIIFSIPGIKVLMQEIEVARFGYLLGTLLDAGLPVTKAIESLENATETYRYKKFYKHLRESVDMGNSFQKSFELYTKIGKILPQAVQQLVVSGEQSGNLNKTLLKVGQVLEAKSDQTTKNLTIIMEPILLVIVWAGVVMVAFAVILPIYSLVGGLNAF
ncbi:MAG: type II secretion system F family protein [Candidatus Pacebacteria bacterium]|nr:type II secretion system F family protein [Candidatus Paceibacterota bacterium]